MKKLRECLRRRKYEAPPPQIVIGHTTNESVKIWVRGDEARRSVRVTVTEGAAGAQRDSQEKVLELKADDDFTGVVPFGPLHPQRRYSVEAHFTRSGAGANGDDTKPVKGSFRTFPQEEAPFSFLHGSCHLSTITVNNTLALAAGASGTKAVRASLDRSPTPTGDFSKLKRFLYRWCGYAAVKWLVKSLFVLSLWLTDWLKQPGEPMLRSPFLRLLGQIETRTLAFKAGGEEEPAVGSMTVGATSGATGYVLHRPEVSGSWADRNAEGSLMLTGVDGEFVERENLKFGERTAARSTSKAHADEPAEDAPAFMIHAGDQIYFDFPFTSRRPALDEYRMAYREAWSGDKALRAFLAQCPHYMTLDDHEIVDQFASDVNAHKYPPGEYLRHARAAYREYVHSRHPDECQESLYYAFQCGTSYFFVMDTRTERCGHSGRMIGRRQLEDFKQWLSEHSDDLKFVVSSVPFVGELRHLAPSSPSDPSQSPLVRKIEEWDDKWCGEGYRRQREEIIDFIADERIERLIFLAGDMHCCYHATMDIGYRPSTIHELGAGPIYQLELSRRDQFVRIYRAETEKGKRFRIELRQFDSSAAGVMKLRVRCVPGELNRKLTTTQEVDWQVIKTLGDAEAIGGRVGASDHRSLSGRIAFWECRP
jgi:hypothetical protein